MAKILNHCVILALIAACATANSPARSSGANIILDNDKYHVDVKIAENKPEHPVRCSIKNLVSKETNKRIISGVVYYDQEIKGLYEWNVYDNEGNHFSETGYFNQSANSLSLKFSLEVIPEHKTFEFIAGSMKFYTDKYQIIGYCKM